MIHGGATGVRPSKTSGFSQTGAVQFGRATAVGPERQNGGIRDSQHGVMDVSFKMPTFVVANIIKGG
jgi:hypothetical protein